jgi:hypothetical protein
MNEYDSSGFKKEKNRWFSWNFNKIPWILGTILILITCFLIVILALVIVDLKKNNTLESEITEKTSSDSLFSILKQGVFDYLGKESGKRINLSFLNKYKFNETTSLNLEGYSSLVDYFNQKLILVKSPNDYLYDTDSKFFIIQGKIELFKTTEKIEKEIIQNIKISYAITTNLPIFSAIKLAEISLDTEKSNFVIKKAFTVCTNEIKSEKRCDQFIGKFYNDYHGIIDEKSTLKGSKHHNNIEDQLKDHDEDLIISNEFEQSTIYVLIFFMNENELLFLNKTASFKKGESRHHQNSLGRIVFMQELTKR